MNRLCLLLLLVFCGTAYAEDTSFYKNPHGLFSTRPDETKSLQSIERYGPVGIGIDLLQPAFVMRIKNVEAGSPAEAAGKLKPGQIIETINGQPLAGIDPRIQLGQILAKAEATDGKIALKIKDVADPVVVTVPVLGAYSETWPLNCKKSDRIVREAADYVAQSKDHYGLGHLGMLFLLSTGDAKDLKVVQEWARTEPAHSYAWYLGYGGIPLTECYLRTGDPVILENIQAWVDSAVKGQYLDAWPGRSGTLTDYGAGHLNAAGTSVLTFLLLAKECGADVPDHALLGALRHFYRYAGRGNNPYGDDRPYTGFVDNGKNGLLAFSMAAAAALTPEGEDSVYAQARDSCAMKSFYLTSYMLHGHTGGGIGEIWRSAAMGLLHDKKPTQYRDFMDSRQWHYDLSRRYDGSFGILGGGSGYDREKWGVAFPLAYTIPRKHLRIAGAPRTKFSKSYQLPKQPWGNDADDIFVSNYPVPDQNAKRQNLSGETLAKDSALHFLRGINSDPQPTDDQVRQYMYHPEFNIRNIAAFKALGVNPGYLGRKSAGGPVREQLVLEFAKHEDPRVRRAIFAALLERTQAMTPELFALAVKATAELDESWMVKDATIQLIGRGTPDQIVEHTDLLIPYLQHEEDWLKNAALQALAPVVADERVYKRVIPAIGQLMRTNQRGSITVGLAPAIRKQLQQASPAAQRLAREELQEAFTGYAGKKHTREGHNITPTYDWHLEGIAQSLVELPGGYDVLYEIARQRYPDEILPYKELFLSADASQFGPKLKQAITPIIMNELIPEHVGRQRRRIEPLAANQVQNGRPGADSVDELAALYQRAGHNDYQWQMFADLRNAEWSYHSFDPLKAEQVPFDQLITRYREVTMPKGMEDWHAKEFDPAKAGWQKAKSPFGTYDGKIPDRPITKCNPGCVGTHAGCYGATPIHTLWEKEVLVMRGTFKVPPVKDGYRYRLRVNTGDHVGSGGGHVIYINGKPLIEAKQGGGRGWGDKPKGAYITHDFLGDLKRGEITIAVKTFVRYNAKYSTLPSSKTPQGKFSLHLEKQKLPPMGRDLVFKSASIVPMTSSDWQRKLDPEDATQDPDDNLFRWDGKFVANPKIGGSWKLIAHVNEVEDFDPAKKREHLRNPPFDIIALKAGGGTRGLQTNGGTHELLWAWSGDMLMNLDRYEAFKMHVREVGGQEYLFVEQSEFSTKHGPDWKPRWWVLKRVKVIAMFGDSTTDRGMPIAVTKRLDAMLDAEADRPIVLNAGKGGDNATAALGRLVKDVLSYYPDVATVSFGLNDTGGKNPDQFKQSLDAMVKRFKAAEVNVLMMTSTPFNNDRHGWAKQFEDLGGLDEYMNKAFCDRTRQVAEEQQLPFIDLHAIFHGKMKQDPDMINTLISSDGVHLTAKGYELIAEYVAPRVKALIEE